MRVILTAAERADIEAALAAYDVADAVCDANPSTEPWTPERTAAVSAWNVKREALDKLVSATFPFLGYFWDGIDAGEGARALLAHAEVEPEKIDVTVAQFVNLSLAIGRAADHDETGAVDSLTALMDRCNDPWEKQTAHADVDPEPFKMPAQAGVLELRTGDGTLLASKPLYVGEIEALKAQHASEIKQLKSEHEEELRREMNPDW